VHGSDTPDQISQAEERLHQEAQAWYRMDSIPVIGADIDTEMKAAAPADSDMTGEVTGSPPPPSAPVRPCCFPPLLQEYKLPSFPYQRNTTAIDAFKRKVADWRTQVGDHACDLQPHPSLYLTLRGQVFSFLISVVKSFRSARGSTSRPKSCVPSTARRKATLW